MVEYFDETYKEMFIKKKDESVMIIALHLINQNKFEQ